MNRSQRHAADELAAGKVVPMYVEGGNSMVPLIHHREPVRLEPVDRSKLEKGDIVLVTVRGRTYTHLIHGIRKNKKGVEVQIGNNRGGINGWTNVQNVHGIVTAVDGKPRGSAKGKTRVTRDASQEENDGR